MIAPFLWISQHPDSFALIAVAAMSFTSSLARFVLTPEFEEKNPGTAKMIRVLAKLTSDVFGAIVEAKKKPAPPSDQTIIVLPEDSKP